MKRDLHRGNFVRWLAVVMAIAICLAFGSQNASAVSLLYQWDFNGPSGNTVAPTIGIGGVLTMSRVTVGNSGLSAPTAGDFRTTPGNGVFGDVNPNDRAFDNSGALYGINSNADTGSFSGMVSSDNTGLTVPFNNKLFDPLGPHGQITVTAWVKLDDGQLNGAFPRLVKFGSQNYDGQQHVRRRIQRSTALISVSTTQAAAPTHCNSNRTAPAGSITQRVLSAARKLLPPSPAIGCLWR